MVRVVWGLAGLGLILLAASLFGSPARILDWRAPVIVLGGMLCFTFARHSIESVFRGTLHALADPATIAAMRTMRTTTHASGALGLVIGLVAAFEGGFGPGFGEAIGTALLPPMYALVLGEFFIAPVLHRRLAQYAASRE